MRRSERIAKKWTNVESGKGPQIVPIELEIRLFRCDQQPNINEEKRPSSPEDNSSPSSSYDCPECNASYRSQKSLRIHKLRYHRKTSGTKCPECPKILSTRFAIKKHLLTHRPKSQWPIQCPLCSQRFQAAHDLRHHFNIVKHQGDPRIPKYQSKEWFELLKQCKVPTSPSETKPTECLILQKEHASENSNTSLQNETTEHQQQKSGNHNDDATSATQSKIYFQSSHSFPEKNALPSGSVTLQSTRAAPLSNLSFQNGVDDISLIDHSYCLREDKEDPSQTKAISPQPYRAPKENATKIRQTVFPFTRNLRPLAPKPLAPKGLNSEVSHFKVNSGAVHFKANSVAPQFKVNSGVSLYKINSTGISPLVPASGVSGLGTNSGVSRPLVVIKNVPKASRSSLKVLKIVDKNLAVIKELLVPVNSRICLFPKPPKIVYPKLSKTTVEKQIEEQVPPKVLSNQPLPKTAFLSNEKVNEPPLDIKVECE